MELRAHDLVSFKSVENLLSDKQMPDWALETLKEGFFGVVRRDFNPDENLMAIGIRGVERGQRFGAWLDVKNITEVIKPLQLTDAKTWKKKYKGDVPDAIKTLIDISPILNEMKLSWGPTGSVAYELATGYQSIKETSDLDLSILALEKISVTDAQNLLDKIEQKASSRLDIQLETPKGGVSLIEFIQFPQVLVKTNKGPILCRIEDLWNETSK